MYVVLCSLSCFGFCPVVLRTPGLSANDAFSNSEDHALRGDVYVLTSSLQRLIFTKVTPVPVII